MGKYNQRIKRNLFFLSSEVKHKCQIERNHQCQTKYMEKISVPWHFLRKFQNSKNTQI